MSPRPAARVAEIKRTLIREIFESAPPEAVNLGLGQPDLAPPALLADALAEAAHAGSAGYGPTQGDLELRAGIAASYPGFLRGPEEVVVTLGCQEATFLALGALVDPGDEVLVPDPGFPGAARAASAWGARARAYPLRAERGFHLDPEEVLALIEEKTRAIVVISPSNPTGSVEPAATMDALSRGAAEKGVALVVDDTYRHLCWVPEGAKDARAPGPPASPAEHVVVCGGLSKSAALTGWRVGWVACPERAFVARLVALQQTVLTCPATPIQRASRVAFDPRAKPELDKLRARFLARRELVGKILAGTSVRHAPLEGAFYAFIDASRAGGGREFARRLLERDLIVVIPGEAFGPLGSEWVRVSYAQDEALLTPALQRLVVRLQEA